MRKVSVIVPALVMLVLLVGCGSDEPAQPVGVAAYLPGEIETPTVAVSGEIEVFRDDSLYYYLNGGAEIYHTYGFREVANAQYLAGDEEISVDLFEFRDPTGAFGLYSTLRPPATEFFDVGVEGFATALTRSFVKGRFVARLTAFEASDKISMALDSLAIGIAELTPGDTTLPITLGPLPDTARIPYSEMIYSMAYLGLGFMNDVYTADYHVDSDTLTLFLTLDTTGQKMDGWRENMPGEVIDVEGLNKLDYDSAPVAVEHDYYGTVVVGTRSGWMAGAVGYERSHRAILAALLESLGE